MGEVPLCRMPRPNQDGMQQIQQIVVELRRDVALSDLIGHAPSPRGGDGMSQSVGAIFTEGWPEMRFQHGAIAFCRGVFKQALFNTILRTFFERKGFTNEATN